MKDTYTSPDGLTAEIDGDTITLHNIDGSTFTDVYATELDASLVWALLTGVPPEILFPRTPPQPAPPQ